MSRKYKCQVCKTEFEKDELLVFDGKNYCSTCYEIEKSRKELYDYICYIFNLKAPGPRNYNMIKSFKEHHPEYTYKGIQQALYYFFEVEHNSVSKANESIGIVPYVYERAQDYFRKQNNLQEKIATKVTENIKKKKVFKVISAKKKEKVLYDIENL